ncbi:hypothetical protein QUV83_01520 [Cellulomonas cellasea]|uniref:hypothetical protein n=1 Tax=Cellulomonas cellasea TaxID=43670 RepID=UPI0025A3E325|nr:hypothetical protein [Cellulomonas cellasea]MDM8083445.1 hypothetical protein [Cellulomonas cellasea]
MITAADLLASVRGRRLCLEAAQRGPHGDQVRVAMFDAARRVDEDRGAPGVVAVEFVCSARSDAAEPLAAPTLHEALTAAAEAGATHVGGLLPALADTVTSAMYWQPPHAEDVVLAEPDVSALLFPIAEAVLAAPQAAWWSGPLDRDAQVRTAFAGVPAPVRDDIAGRRLSRWRESVLDQERWFAQERAGRPHRRMGGMWWATPALSGLDVTTRALPGEGSAALWLTEDEEGWASADLTRCAVDPAARVLEITGPQDWAALVAAFPLDVTASRRPDWYEAVDARDGSWLIPDWAAVAEAYDGVHVSVLGWLLTSGTAVQVAPGETTTLAGWCPDATWWLTDTVREGAARMAWSREGWAWRPADSAQAPTGLA